MFSYIACYGQDAWLIGTPCRADPAANPATGESPLRVYSRRSAIANHSTFLLARVYQAVVSQRSLNQVNGQISAKSREKRILELTTRQLDAIPAGDDVKMYKGVGKA